MTQEGANIRKGDYDQTASQREPMIKTRAFFKKKSLSWELVLGGGRIKMTGMNIKRRLGHPGERTLSAETLSKLISVQTEIYK